MPAYFKSSCCFWSNKETDKSVKFIRSHCFAWLVPKLGIPLVVYLLTFQSFCSSRTCRDFGSKPSDRLGADANPRSEHDQRISSVLKSRGLVVCRLWVITHLPTFPWRLLPFRYLIKCPEAVPISFQCMKLGHITWEFANFTNVK